MRLRDRLAAMVMHGTARWTVRYGDNLRFAGTDLPAPSVVRVPTRHGPVRVHVYRPAADSGGAYVHFHGGAWLMRYPAMDDWWCRYVAATAGVTVYNVDYRCGPYVAFPVAQHQCFDVASRIAADRVAVGGFSSGGGLAAAVCLQARDAGGWRPRLQVLGVPALDLATDPDPAAGGMISPGLRDLVRRVYFPDPATRRHPYASPLLADDLTGLPRAVVLTAERDALRADGESYVSRLRAAGVEVLHDRTPGADHYFLTEDPERARTTMALVAAEIARALT
ncbi:alpha/beta hydrolase [Amycolatopsis sp., V23-08]|uniref:Alpha/beta hydrolase n=1 Tax=Amycolatopsis heterodermiae TaxID=3110235 RepID=A0ABU5R3B4_9PSEU|nr:alpha/beta hydrolase [Amycolatopsis sp., V23-08]MEA5360706.1 alpha/beta hydrolase [Amycolatopsis sp., V23-08]